MTIDGNTIAAESGMVLINVDGDVIGNKLSLGCGDAVKNYSEITIAEAEGMIADEEAEDGIQ